MIVFLDGPGKGRITFLARAPLFLRVVIDHDGTVDALDQLTDEAKPTETIHVYRRDGEPSSRIVCSRGRGGGCRQFAVAQYRLSEAQPDDATARDNLAWKAWVAVQYEKEEP